MKKQFIKVLTEGLKGLTKGKVYPVLSNDAWDMALVFLFIDDVGRIQHHHDWEDYWEEDFEVIEEEMTEREVMIFNSGISHGLWTAREKALASHRSELYKKRTLRLKHNRRNESGYLWLNDGVQGIADVLDDLYDNDTDHFVDGSSDQLV